MRHLILLAAALALSACNRPVYQPAGGSAEDAEPAEPDIRAEDVTYEAGGTTLKGHLVYDAARTGARPGVLVVHEWWGQNAYARMRARKLAELGYTALAVDMYGEGKTVETPDEAGKLAGGVFGDLAAAQARFEAARALLAGRADTDGAKIAAIGYCFGGGVILHMARAGVDLTGVASFHGNLGTQTPATAGAITGDIMICTGADDPLCPPEQVATFKTEMNAAGVDFDIHTYAGATHAFTNPAATEVGKKYGLPVAYDEAADTDSWAKLVQFLAGVFAE